MITIRQSPLASVSVFAVLLCGLVFFFRGSSDFKHDEVSDLTSGGWLSSTTKGLGGLDDIRNSTLGFQKIYILSMPGRTDKRDALSISAYLTGLDIEFIDGVNGSTMPERAFPPVWNYDEPVGTIGCWRGHMNIYQKMVREGIQTAMIMEDDVDWDVMIKSQMTEFAHGTRYLQNVTSSTLSPYGDDWSIISTGHCGLWNRIGEDQKYWVVDDDPTVVVPDQRKWSRRPNLTPAAISGNRTRLVFNPYQMSCLASYAVSIKGAARILYDQSILPHAKGIDSGLGGMCKGAEYGLNTCIGVYPMITGVHRPAGDASRDSDRKKLSSGFRKTAVSDNLVYPVRLNLNNLLKGSTVVKAQSEEYALIKEVDYTQLKLPSGKGFTITPDEYVKSD